MKLSEWRTRHYAANHAANENNQQRLGQRFVNQFLSNRNHFPDLFNCVNDSKAMLMIMSYLEDHQYGDEMPPFNQGMEFIESKKHKKEVEKVSKPNYRHPLTDYGD